MAIYTLWDTESARQLGEYTDIENAFAVVRRDIGRGKGYLWNNSALIQLTGDDEEEHIVLFEDEELVERARAAPGGTPPASNTQRSNPSGIVASSTRSPRTPSQRSAVNFGFDTLGFKPFGGIDIGALTRPFGGIDLSALRNPSGITNLDALTNPYRMDVGAFGLRALSGFDFGAFSAGAAMARATSGLTPTFAIAPLSTSIASGLFATENVSKALLSLNSLDWDDYFAMYGNRLGEMISGSAAPRIPQEVADLWRLASDVALQTTKINDIGNYVIASSLGPENPFVYHHTFDTDYLAILAGEEDSDEGEDVVIVEMWRLEDGRLAG